MPNKLITFHQGLVTSRDASVLDEGELSEAVGCEYREGSMHLYKQPGRASADTLDGSGAWNKSVLAGAIQAIQRFEYDSGTDVLGFYCTTGAVFESTVFTTSDTSTLPASKLSGLTGSAIPEFASMRDQWLMVNGIDDNYIRESGTVTGSSPATNWRVAGFSKPPTVLELGSAPGSGSTSQVSLALAGGGYTTPANAESTDVDSATFTYANISVGGGGTKTQSYEFAANLVSTNRVLRVVHRGVVSDTGLDENPGWPGSQPESDITATQQIEVSDDNGDTWTIYDTTFKMPYGKKTTLVPIDDAIDLLDVHVRFTTVVADSATTLGYGEGRVHAVWVDDSAAAIAFSTTNTLYYGYTERYYDSNGIVHESLMSDRLEVAAQTDVYGILLQTFPLTPQNATASEYVIYRTLDEEGGGYPNMYEIDTIAVGVATTYTDVGNVSFTDILAQGSIYETLNVLYPDGSTFSMEVNSPPPISKKITAFQGSMVYVPVDSSRIYYSLPATIGPANLEKVPSLYYLEFVTPYEDIVNNAQSANSGRSLIIYFPRYSMMVNYLPQATDPGVFDQRVTEYVSNTRGAAGPHAATEITLDTGRTFAVAVDALGVWATDGVSSIVDLSTEIDWDTIVASANLATVRLINNQKMYRLEMLYDSDGAGVMKEMHFYYERLKESGLPHISGPHPASTGTTDGWRCKFYAVVGNKWIGYSGHNDSSASGGIVFIEREIAADESLAYDGANSYVPFQVTSGDTYFEGLGKASIITFAYPKFGSKDASTKTLDPTASSNRSGFFGTFKRDGASETFTKSKAHTAGTQRKIYWQAYGDRHKIQIKNIDSTAMPELIAYEIEVREGGDGRDK